MQSAGVAVHTKREGFWCSPRFLGESSTYWSWVKNLPGDTLASHLHTKCISLETRFESCQISELDELFSHQVAQCYLSKADSISTRIEWFSIQKVSLPFLTFPQKKLRCEIPFERFLWMVLLGSQQLWTAVFSPLPLRFTNFREFFKNKTLLKFEEVFFINWTNTI